MISVTSVTPVNLIKIFNFLIKSINTISHKKEVQLRGDTADSRAQWKAPRTRLEHRVGSETTVQACCGRGNRRAP